MLRIVGWFCCFVSKYRKGCVAYKYQRINLNWSTSEINGYLQIWWSRSVETICPEKLDIAHLVRDTCLCYCGIHINTVRGPGFKSQWDLRENEKSYCGIHINTIERSWVQITVGFSRKWKRYLLPFQMRYEIEVCFNLMSYFRAIKRHHYT